MKQSILRRMLSLCLMFAMLIGLLPAAVAAESAATKALTPPEGRLVISQTDYALTNGVTETQVILNDQTGSSQVYGYMMTVAPTASVTFKASYGGYYKEGSTVASRAEAAKNLKWDLRTTTSQAAAYEKATGETVIAATNADYYNMQTAQCCGYLIMEGNLIQTGITQEPYFAVLRDGSYEIRDYGTDCSDVAEAISGPFYLVKDGVIQLDGSDSTLAPRNAIGLKADGTVVTFLADGRADISAGMTTYEVAKVMAAQGVQDAIYLDGGGSATLASRHEGSETLEIQNHPSDGPERVVASALLLVSTAKATGAFDHAALYPRGEMYLAHSQVQFTADGVDSVGYPAQIPSGAQWKLASPAYGTIDNSGLFRSNGTCGTVTVNLEIAGQIVGSASIEIREPEELYFASERLNIGFNKSSDLGLTLRSGSRTMLIGNVDLDWEIESLTDGVPSSGIGSIKNNIFTSVKANQTLEANITASYTKADGSVLSDHIAVEIGKMPIVIWDFEPDENGEVYQVGEYDWGRNGNTFGDSEMQLTYIGWNDETDTYGTSTKNGPFTFGGTYIADSTDKTYDPAAYILGSAGYNFFTWHTDYMQQHSATAKVVNESEGGEVRFGDYALQLNYDYTVLNEGYRNVNEYLYYSSTEDEAKTNLYAGVDLEGIPTGLGAWVYAPEGTSNFWLWTTIAYYDEASDTYKRANIHFTTQEGRSIQYTGIYWEGWMYVEADLTPYSKYVTEGHPLKLVNGMPIILLTFIPGGSANENGDKIPMGDFTKGELYFDNFRVVYGDTIDDMESPVISGLSANGTALGEQTTTLTSSTLNLSAAFSDPEGDNATGINVEKTALYVDGLRQELSSSTATGASAQVTLPNGVHSILLTVADGFGNVTKITRYVRINDASSKLGTISLSGAAEAVLGEDYSLNLNIGNSSAVSEFSAKIAFNDSFGEPTVTFAGGYTGSFEVANHVLSLQASANAPKSGTAATISFHVDPSVARGTVLTYEVKEGSFTDNGKALSFGSEPTSVGVTAAYELSADIMVVNSTGKLYVTSADGSAAGKVSVYRVIEGAEPQLLGTTNSAGVLVTNKLCQNVGESYIIYAQGEKGYSFRLSGVTSGLGSDEVTPYNIRLNAVTDPTTSQSVTWFSTPEYTQKKAVVQYAEGALKRSEEDTYMTATGTSGVYAFNGGAGDNEAALINRVMLEGLKPGTTYRFRVGDGVEGHWSAWRQFTTMTADADTTFFVIGDTQLLGTETEDSTEVKALHQIANAVNTYEVDFGLQTGDFIDTANSLPRWNQVLGIFSNDYPNLPLLQVMGNHEYYGDTSGNLGAAIFDLPGRDYYSVEYGDVYVAVINCNANVENAAKWLVEDAAKTDCTWKVLTLHQPPYYTNPKGSSDPYNRGIPAAAEAAGIDFVFSGHDHAYARTEPLRAGAVNAEEGVVYFICGDLGEKSRDTEYAAENNPAFHFAKISQDYEAIYLLVNATEKEMTVTAYDLDGSVVDTFTKKAENGGTIVDPQPTHTYQYDRKTDKLICEDCGEEAPADYTGFAKDKLSGKTMYFLVGRYKTGWFLVGEELFHFDETTGEAHDLTVLEDVKTTCGEQGHLSVRCSCGETYEMEYALPSGHHNVPYQTAGGETYYVCSVCGRISRYDLTFVDVEDSDWYAETIDYVVRAGLFGGKSAVSFDPEAPMTRAEMVTVLWRNAGSPDFNNVMTVPYDDCETGSWYTAALNWATRHEIVNGVGENKFEPDSNISREQIVTILFRYADFLGMDVSKRADISKDFSDSEQVSDYAEEAMAWAVAEGLIRGDNGEIKPLDSALRAEVATMVMRFVELQKAQKTE